MGATAGIGVGAALGGLALIALGAWLFLRRRKSRVAGGADNDHGKSELPGESAEKQRTKAGELSTRGEIFEFGPLSWNPTCGTSSRAAFKATKLAARYASRDEHAAQWSSR
ncbi:hypothetical protein LTR12_010413 [Friedmanniomyces endolithicus]|nr:hypothetical protein LTR74_007561 [Friedmanniomyces endolithicus]KAK1815154.1 hypothetical protein LTR12_010413 [Friedmanniomyces endolithicus]